jgi:undecaprenyl-diphosphatase
MNLARVKQVVRRERGTLIATAAVLLLIAGFALLAGEVAEEQTESFDRAILRGLRDADGQPRGPYWLQTALLNLSALGSTAVTTLVVVLASAFLLLKRRARLALLVIGCGVGAAIAIVVLKDHVGRERPMIVVALESARGLSFPSGHSLIASAIYPTLGILLSTAFVDRRLKVFTIATAVVLALVIGFTRVYLGVHYPTDVIGGWMLGLAWAIVCGLVCRRLQREGLVEQAASRSQE